MPAVCRHLVALFFRIYLEVFRSLIVEIALECEGDRVKAQQLSLRKGLAIVFYGKILKVFDLQNPSSNC